MRNRLWVGRVIDLTIVVLAIATLWRLGAFEQGVPDVLPSLTLARPGVALKLPGVDWTRAARHAVLRIKTDCAASAASVDLYRRLGEVVGRTGTELLVVTDEDPKYMKTWLADQGVRHVRLVRLDYPITVGWQIVPTIFLVDRAGVITDALVEKLTEPEERELFARLSEEREVPLDNTFFAQERTLSSAVPLPADVLRLDLARREVFRARPGVVNMPADELSVRASSELDRNRPIAVECERAELSECRNAGRFLRKNGFQDVVIAIRE